MEGKLLGNRYEILERLGGGGMAQVFKARCRLLDRLVAIKFLRDEYLHDEDFVRRFRREARAAAALSHPNIVGIYDVGQEGDLQYIVMEYIQGQNLKDYLRSRGLLPAEEAVYFGREIAKALVHAHRHGIVHRDIKPHNILVTQEGQVKVTDFGIARAVGGSTLTATGNIIGSVHYISPEQAKGGFSGIPSDLYSLGVVLYEMVTGQVPFQAENPVSIALKHLNENPRPPRDYNPQVPPGLEVIILKALSKEERKRYQSAGEILQDLEGLGTRDITDTNLFPAEMEAVSIDDSPTQIAGVPKGRAPMGRNGKRRATITGLLSLLLLFSLFFGGYKAWQWLFDQPLVEVPQLVGRGTEEAQVIAEDLGLVYRVLRQQHHEEPEGTVIDQYPEAGTFRKEGNVVEVVLSQGPIQGVVPDIRGLTLQAAEIELEKEMLLLGQVDKVNDDMVPVDLIVDQEPRAGESLEPGSRVKVYLSTGPERPEITVPSLRGQDLEQAVSRLRELNLDPGEIKEDYSNIYVAGKVIDQSPSPYERVEAGHAVDLVVSLGPPINQ